MDEGNVILLLNTAQKSSQEYSTWIYKSGKFNTHILMQFTYKCKYEGYFTLMSWYLFSLLDYHARGKSNKLLQGVSAVHWAARQRSIFLWDFVMFDSKIKII